MNTGGSDLKLIWTSFIFEIIILAIMKPLITDYDSIGLIAVLIHITFSLVVLMSYKIKNKLIYIWLYCQSDFYVLGFIC